MRYVNVLKSLIHSGVTVILDNYWFLSKTHIFLEPKQISMDPKFNFNQIHLVSIKILSQKKFGNST